MNYYPLKTCPGFNAGITLRDSGASKAPYAHANFAFYVGDQYSDVLSNREHLATKIRIPCTRWILPKITHSIHFQKVSENDKGSGAYSEDTSIPDCDALYTFDPSLLLGVFSADCATLVITEQSSKLCGVLHAGWPGSVNRLVADFLTHLSHEESIDLSRCQISFGPNIQPENFEVGQDVLEQAKQKWVNPERFFTQCSPTHFLFDFNAMNIEQCLECGILPSHIHRYPENPSDYPDRYYSYRRTKQTGRHLTFVCRQ